MLLLLALTFAPSLVNRTLPCPVQSFTVIPFIYRAPRPYSRFLVTKWPPYSAPSLYPPACSAPVFSSVSWSLQVTNHPLSVGLVQPRQADQQDATKLEHRCVSRCAESEPTQAGMSDSTGCSSETSSTEPPGRPLNAPSLRSLVRTLAPRGPPRSPLAAGTGAQSAMQ